MPTYEIKVQAGPHIDTKSYPTATEAIEALEVYKKQEAEAKVKAKEDEKVEKAKKEKEEQEKKKEVKTEK